MHESSTVMAPEFRFTVDQQHNLLRLDRFLARQLSQNFSRTAVQRSIDAGTVTVDGRVAKASRLVAAGQEVVARLDEAPRPDGAIPLAPEPIPLDIVFEDSEMLVVNKPPGMVAHPAPGHWTGTLVNAILWHVSEAGANNVKPSGFQSLPRAGIVHRLDKDTSGLLLVAKTEQARRSLGRQLRARTLGRRYVALVEGHVPDDEGTIDASIGRHARHRKLMAVQYLGGRHAVSHYRVLARCAGRPDHTGSWTLDAGCWNQAAVTEVPSMPRRAAGALTFSPRLRYSVIEVRLETGRTHQIRVHVAHLGYPVVGDPVYGRPPHAQWAAMGITRQLLHAYAIRFEHPATGQPTELSVGVPDDMSRWIPPAVRGVFNAMKP